MNELFGISMTAIMVVLAGVFAICLAVFCWVYAANRTMFRMGLRNIGRRRAQSSLIVLGLMLATVIITAAFTTGDVIDYSITRVAYDNLHRTDIAIHTFRPTGEAATDGAALDQVYAPDGVTPGLERAFAGDAEIEGFMPFLFEPIPVLNPRTRLGEPKVVLAGFDTARLEQFGGLHYTNGDRVDLAALGADEVLVGKRAAGKLEARVGDSLTLFVGDKQQTLRVAGIVKDERSSGALEFGGGEIPSMAAHLATVQQLTGHEGEISGISVVLRGDERSSLKRTDAAADTLERFKLDEAAKAAAGIPGLTFQVEKNKQDAVRGAELAGNVFTTMFIVLGLFSIAAGTMLIFTLFVMLAAERRREMGIARAVGAERRHLVQAFLAEGMVYDLLAGIVGTALGVAVAFVVIVGGVRLMIGGELSFITPHVTPRSLVVSFCLGGTLTFVTVVVSSIQISRLNIVAAIRGQSNEKGSRTKSRTRWLWVVAGVPALIILPLGLYLILRKGFGMPWAWVVGPAGIVLGIAMMVLGEGADQAFPFTVGISLVPVAAGSLAVYYGLRSRPVWSAVGGFLIFYWLLPEGPSERIFGRQSGGMEMFVVSGIFIVAGFATVIVFNARVLTRMFAARRTARGGRYGVAVVLVGMTAAAVAVAVAMGDSLDGLGQLSYLAAAFAGSFALLSYTSVRFPRFAPALKMAIAYPLANRFRTGMTIAMFSLVIFSITVMGVINASFLEMFAGDEGRGGWDIQVSTNWGKPVEDIRAELAAEGSFDPRAIAAVGRATNFRDESQEARTPGGDWDTYPIIAGDAGFFIDSLTKLEARAPGYETDKAVFEAVQAGTRFAVIDSSATQATGFGGGFGVFHVTVKIKDGQFEPFEVELHDPATQKSQTVTVIGILSSQVPGNILFGIYVNETTYRAIYGSPDYATQYLRLAPGTDARQAAKQIKAALVTSGVQAVSIDEQIDEMLSQSRAFLRIFQLFMGLGLVVGIASLGVIALRSVVERRQQIGMLRAIGYQKSTVSLSFLLESGFIAVTGIFSGVIGAAILSYNLVNSSYMTATDSLTFFMPWGEVVTYSLVAFVFALLMTWWPSRRASSVPIAEALRYE